MQQNEKKGFTKREKRLILFMAVIGFTALMVVYVIIPFFNRLQDENDRYNALSLEQMQLNILLNNAPVIRENNEKALNDFYEARERFFNEAHMNDIGQRMTNLCLAHNLSVQSQRLTAATTSPAWNAFMIMPVQMNVSGSYENLKRLLDTVADTEYLRITRIAFNMLAAQAEDRFQGVERVTIHFEVIMMKDLEV